MIMPRELLEFYREDGHPIKCRHCNAVNFKEVVRDQITTLATEGPYPVSLGVVVCEKEYVCSGCGDSAAYWAYGRFDPTYYGD